jgi:hypothetical protein
VCVGVLYFRRVLLSRLEKQIDLDGVAEPPLAVKDDGLSVHSRSRGRRLSEVGGAEVV